jgi:hypothetical protein
MVSNDSVVPDRPTSRRYRRVLAAVAMASVLIAQVSLLYSQSRVLARQEKMLHEREAKVDQMNDLAGQILKNMENLAKAQQDAPVRAAHWERASGGEQPLVILPLPE